MTKLLMILAGSVFLATSAFASNDGQTRGNRDYLPPGYCWKHNCTNHDSLTSIKSIHTHILTSRQSSKLDREERRIWESGKRGSVRQ